MAGLQRIAPIFPVQDVEASLAFYAELGFDTRRYDGEGGGAGYGFVTLEGIELHVGAVDGAVVPVSAYLFVDDADALADRWREAGAVVHDPIDTPWGRHEGVVVDLDGNIIRFGSPVR